MLPQRIISATIGIVYIILMLYIGGWFFKISVLLMAFILMHEFYYAFINKGYRPANILGYIFLVIFFYQIIIGGEKNMSAFMGLAFIASLALPVFFQKMTIIDAMVTVFGAIYPGTMILYLIPLGFEAKPFNYSILLLTFLVTWSTDTFAYFTGIKFGKRKLCPFISPKKTVEGSVGGLIGSVFLAVVAGWLFNTYFGANVQFVHFIIIGLIGGTFSQLGDLAASAIKRFCGIKDFGKLLPGHGGLMDRFDSLLFTAPLIYLYFLMFQNL